MCVLRWLNNAWPRAGSPGSVNIQPFQDLEDELWIEEAGQRTFVCDGVLLPCGRSRHVKLPDSLPCGAFSRLCCSRQTRWLPLFRIREDV